MSPKPITTNTLFYGDNLDILREHIADESMDLIYLDPPFNSSRSYNVLFKDEGGKEAEAQITAFEDTWHWNSATEKTYQELVTLGGANIASLIGALHQSIGTNQMMAYLVMMAARLVELHRVLKPTGSLYLHCDPTASHYLKIVLDTIFGPRNFRNEIVWRRKGGSALKGMRVFSTATDFILFYTKTDDYIFNTVYMPLDQEYIDEQFTKIDEKGRRFQATVMRSPNPRPNLMYDYKGYKMPPNGWSVSREKMEHLDREGRLYFPEDKSKQIYRKIYLDEYPGQPANNLWTDIATLKGQSAELLGYPTQKPVALLERIIQSSSNPNDLVLDPFCGCGTTIAAAQKLGRRWVGIDITHLSIALQKYRLKDAFNLEERKDYAVVGEPEDLSSAQQLAKDDRYQFQWWALSLIKARPLGGEGESKKGKKGADKGIDGVITFIDDASGKPKRALVQVKSGHVKRGDIGELRGTIEREGAAIGLFLTLEKPSREMVTEAAAAGFYHSQGWDKDYPKIQIFTIEELLNGAEVKMPPASITFKQAPKTKQDDPDAPKQAELDL